MMLNFLGFDRPATFLHATQNGKSHVMPEAARSLAQHCVTFYETPTTEDRTAGAFDFEGRITPEWLVANTAIDRAEYYICGPRAFMTMAVNGLKAAGVADSRIRYEFFGPALALGAA
ncbi:hypothetical protein [Ruegeria arenilitoris]|uniref:hypothetical protein n=1 Tax=Ruegeria arenilitoris TaxID=1173585 RepID=UPI00147CAA59|nr:hypothetical protein [Ruegeria arenilitoris]